MSETMVGRYCPKCTGFSRQGEPSMHYGDCKEPAVCVFYRTIEALNAEPADTPASPLHADPIGPNSDIGPADRPDRQSEADNG